MSRELCHSTWNVDQKKSTYTTLKTLSFIAFITEIIHGLCKKYIYIYIYISDDSENHKMKRESPPPSHSPENPPRTGAAECIPSPAVSRNTQAQPQAELGWGGESQSLQSSASVYFLH